MLGPGDDFKALQGDHSMLLPRKLKLEPGRTHALFTETGCGGWCAPVTLAQTGRDLWILGLCWFASLAVMASPGLEREALFSKMEGRGCVAGVQCTKPLVCEFEDPSSNPLNTCKGGHSAVNL